MRYAVISDIHSNLEALKAVIDELSKDPPGSHLFLGDIVGYGADTDSFSMSGNNVIKTGLPARLAYRLSEGA